MAGFADADVVGAVFSTVSLAYLADEVFPGKSGVFSLAGASV